MISWINYWMTVIHNNVLPPRYFLWGSHNMLQCYFLTHRSNITHLSISVYDSLRTVPVKQCHCRCCDPWLVYTAHNVRDAPKEASYSHIALTHYRRHIQSLAEITWFSISITLAPELPTDKFMRKSIQRLGCWDWAVELIQSQWTVMQTILSLANNSFLFLFLGAHKS